MKKIFASDFWVIVLLYKVPVNKGDRVFKTFNIIIFKLSNLFIWWFGFIAIINPRLTKPFFVTRLTKGGGVVTTPSLDFLNRTPYEIDFGINR